MVSSAKTALIVVTVLTLAGVAVLASAGQWIEAAIDAPALGHWIRSQGVPGAAAFALAGALLTGIGLPRQLVALCAGYGFDLLTGTLIAIVSVSCGALLTFTFSRYLARPWVKRRFPDAISKVDAFIHDQPFLKIVTIRFAPVGTNMLTNLASGTTSLPAFVFFIASIIGFLPQTLIFVLIGNGLAVNSQQRLYAALVLGIISLVLCWIIYQRSKNRRSATEPELQ